MKRIALWFAIIGVLLGLIALFISLLNWGSPSPYFEWVVILFVCYLVTGAVNVYMNYAEVKEIDKHTKLAEDLFIRNFGKKADKVEPILRKTCRYGPLAQILSDKTLRVKFWSENTVSKGTVDVKSEVLYLEEPELMPVYADESIPLWKEVSKIYSGGMPKKVEFYDENELVHGQEYLDKNGALKEGSWRRYKGTEEYWDPKKQKWKPI